MKGVSLRRFTVLVSAAAAIAACAVVFGTGVAAADPGNGAVVQRDPYGAPHTCQLIDTQGNYWTFDCTIQVVIAPDGTVNEFLKGPITGGSDAPSTAIHDVTTADTGLLCDFTDGGTTSIVKGTVTPSGQVNLTCRL
jgi:hypothetical protein